MIAGCTASAEDVRPPADQLFFPTGLAMAPDESVLFVANANSELRYDSGSVDVVNLATVQAVLNQWLTPSRVQADGCSPDPDHSETLVCDEAQFFNADAGARVGNFATELALQDFSAGGSVKLRVFVPTRGDPSVAWADYDGQALRCSEESSGYTLCDDAHRLTSLRNNPDLAALPIEPFGVFADARTGIAMVTHLFSGSVTLINAPADSSQVAAVDVIGNVFAPDLTSLQGRGASGIDGRPGPDGDIVYVGSSTENRIQTFTVGDRNSEASYLLPGNYFFLDAVGSPNGSGTSNNTRGMKFSPSGDRLYIANRTPPSLQVYDTSLSTNQIPLNTPLGASDICREASMLAVADFGDPVGERVYVTCFLDGQIYVVDPAGQSQVEDVISVGRGPFAAVTSSGKGANAQGRKLLFVTNNLEDTISVIDITTTSPTRNRVVLRIGIPRAP